MTLFLRRLHAAFSVLVCLGCMLPMPASAADIKLEVQLVWAANEATSPDKSHTKMEGETAAKLSKVLKWKHYFLVKKQEVAIPTRTSKRVKLSDQCEIELKELEGPRIEVKVIGQGKHVRTIAEQVSKTDLLTIAGDDKNDCAWFIVIKEL